MIAAELRGGNRPSLNEALGWIGLRVDDIYGVAIGRLEDVWIDPGTGEPRWLLVKEGRFGGRSTLVPFSDATAGEGSVWIPYERDVVREAPQIEPGVPLTQQVEATLRNHYAANTAAAVSHGSQAAPGEPRQTAAPQDPATTHATIRLAAAEPPPEPEPIAPPRLPERPPPPVNPPPGQEQASSAFGHAPPASRFEASGGGRPQAPPPRQQAPQQPYPRQPPQPQPPYQEQFADQPPPPASPYQQPQQPAPQQQPPAQQPPPAPADPLASLADLPAGHMIEIELTGSLTISGELRQVRIIPPDPGSGHRG